MPLDLFAQDQTDYDDIIAEASKLHGVEPELIQAMIDIESGGDPSALSSKGASGLMQLMPSTAKAMGVEDSTDPRQNIFGGTKYIAQQLKATGGDVSLALARYNAGPDNVTRYGGIPPFSETQKYVPKVQQKYNKYKGLRADGTEKGPGFLGTLQIKQTPEIELAIENYKSGNLNEIQIKAFKELVNRGRIDLFKSKETKDPLDLFADESVSEPEPADYEYDIPGLPSVEGVPMSLETKQAISSFYTPALEMGGMGLGTTVGVPGGPVSMLAGGTLGYTIGKSTARALDEWLGLVESLDIKERAIQTAEDIGTGATYEMIGQGTPALIGKSVKGAWALGMKIPGVKEFITRLKKFSPSLNKAEVINKTKDILKEYKESLDLGLSKKGSVAEARAGVEAFEQGLIKKSEAAVKTAVEKTSSLRGQNAQEVGETLFEELRVPMAQAKKHVNALYKAIPETTVSPYPLVKTLKNIITDYKKKGGGKDTFPSALVKQMRDTIFPKGGNIPNKVPFEKLWNDWKPQIGEAIRDAERGANPNFKLSRRLKMLKNGINESMNQLEKSGDEHIVDAYNMAKNAFIKYHDTFRKGTVSEVLRPGNLVAGNRIPFSNIPPRFFKQKGMDAADDLIRAVGKEKSGKLIEDYAAQDLLTGRLTVEGMLKSEPARQWLLKNKAVLQKYGLYNKFEQVISSGHVADITVKNMTAFNKTTASKILNGDVEKIIKNVFSGSQKNSQKIAIDLLNTPGIKGNKAAIEGIKDSFKDFLLDSMKGKYTDLMGVPIKNIVKAKQIVIDYMPAIKELYKNEPKKIKALTDYHKLLSAIEQTIAESTKGPVKNLVESITQLGFIQIGAGWKYSASRNIAKRIYEMTGRGSKNDIEILLRRAIYDPELSKIIMSMAEGAGVETSKKMINHQLLKYGIYTSDKLQDQQ